MKRMRLKYYLRALGIGILVTALLMGFSQKGQAQMTDEEILQRAAELERENREGTLLENVATASPQPTEAPASQPTETPAAQPTVAPTAEPTVEPTAQPTATPTVKPTAEPTAKPTAAPTAAPTAEPTATPTAAPTAKPTATPTAAPTAEPTAKPTATPTAAPTAAPTAKPTATPTTAPTEAPTGDTVTLVINRGESSITVSKNLQELGLVDDYKAYDRFLCDNGYDHSISTGTYEIPVGATYEEIARIISKKR